MRTNYVTLITGQQITVGAFTNEYIEVVEPEIGHYFLQLTLAVDSSQQLGLHQFVNHNLLRIIQRHQRFALLCVHALEELVAFAAFKRSGERPLVFRRHFEDFSHPLVDRKSTCLNSSHRTISYAVFCLKKKNL